MVVDYLHSPVRWLRWPFRAFSWLQNHFMIAVKISFEEEGVEDMWVQPGFIQLEFRHLISTPRLRSWSSEDFLFNGNLSRHCSGLHPKQNSALTLMSQAQLLT